MHTLRFALLLSLACWLPAAESPVDEDSKLLAQHGVGRDGPALLEFLRARSPGAEDRPRIARLLGDLGSDSFDEREAASTQLARFGPAVLDDLKKLRDHSDFEVRRRVGFLLGEIESGPGVALPIAAVRRVAEVAPVGAVAGVLRYLPFAEDEAVEEEIVLGLDRLTRGKAVDPALSAALKSTSAKVRGVAGQVLARVGSVKQRADLKPLLADDDPGVRLRVALGLIAANERDAVPPLIELLAHEQQQVRWQAEEVLYRLAGEKGPQLDANVLKDDRRKARDVWAAWWRDHGAGVDLASLTDARQLGLTLGIEYNTGRVWEAGPDRSLRFDITGLQGPMEAQILPGGRVLIAESNGRKVTERDLKGNVLVTIAVEGQEPTGCQRMPNGNTFVSSYGAVREYDRDGKQVYAFNLPQGSNAIRKHRNGNVMFATDENIIELDTAGKEVRRVSIPKMGMYVGLRDLPGDRFLLANSTAGKVLEVDRTGKILWEARVAGACGIERTAAGHTLVATSGRVVELDRAGNTVWEFKTTGYVRRVHRR